MANMGTMVKARVEMRLISRYQFDQVMGGNGFSFANVF